MSKLVDARGLSCPQPVLMTMGAIEEGGEPELEVLVDTDTSAENVSRAAQSRGWKVTDVVDEDGGYRVLLKQG